MNIPFTAFRRFIALICILVATLVLSSLTLGTFVIVSEIDGGLFYKLFQFLNLDLERNLPTWFSSFLLTVNGLTLLLVAYLTRAQKHRHFAHWLVLGIIFFMLSIDESAQLHEQIIRPTRTALNTDGLLYNAWIIPAGILVIFIGIFYLPFLFSLPRGTQKTFILAGFLYVGGAIGVEAIGGYYFSSVLNSSKANIDLMYFFITHIEETFEMVGLIVFLNGLFHYLQATFSASEIPVNLTAPEVIASRIKPDVAMGR